MRKLYKIECEWDLDQNGKYFASEEAAVLWLREVWESDIEYTVDEAIYKNMVIIEKIDVDDSSDRGESLIKVVIFCVPMYDGNGKNILVPHLTYEDAIKDCDGDQEPFMIETFKGSNIYNQAVRENTND